MLETSGENCAASGISITTIAAIMRWVAIRRFRLSQKHDQTSQIYIPNRWQSHCKGLYQLPVAA
jgi:hypothetical protein